MLRWCARLGTDEPEAYDGVSGIMEIAANNGQGIRAAFKLRNNLYFAKERSLYVTATDGVNEPSLWGVEEVSNAVGTPSAHGVGFGEEWVVIAGRSGLYYFDGGEPGKALAGNSAHLGRDQLAVRRRISGCRWIRSTNAFSSACRWAPPRSRIEILMLDYTEGLQDPLVARCHRPSARANGRRGRSPRIPARLIERPNGVAQIFFGSNDGSGENSPLTPGAFSDDGAAINSYYTTAYLAATGISGRNLFGYLTAYVQGAGSLALSAFSPGDVTLTSLGNWTLGAPPRATWSNSSTSSANASASS